MSIVLNIFIAKIDFVKGEDWIVVLNKRFWFKHQNQTLSHPYGCRHALYQFELPNHNNIYFFC